MSRAPQLTMRLICVYRNSMVCEINYSLSGKLPLLQFKVCSPSEGRI
jgi:hypothetical protein